MSEHDRTTGPNTASSGAGRTPGTTSDGVTKPSTASGVGTPVGGNPDIPAQGTPRHETETTFGSDTGSSMRETAAGAGEKLKSRAIEEAEHRKNDAADSLHAFADSIRSAADDLSRKDQSAAARVVQEAARGLESLSRTVHDRSVVDASRSIADYGRRHPVAFVAGGLLAGLAVGRFLKASGEHRHGYEDGHSDTNHSYGTAGSQSGYGTTAQSPVGTDGRHPGAGQPSRVGTPTTPTTRSTAVLGDNDGNP